MSSKVIDLSKYREKAPGIRRPSPLLGRVEYDKLTRREKMIYVAAWITGANDENAWICRRVDELLSLPVEEIREYLRLSRELGDGLPDAIKQLVEYALEADSG